MANFPSLPAPVTNRTHCIAWSDWASQPQIELNHGIRLDTNYYYWPSTWIIDRPGFFTGSGMPMRFANLDGTMIDVYQATTQMTDESGQAYPYDINTLLTNALGPQGFTGRLPSTPIPTWRSPLSRIQWLPRRRRMGCPSISSKQMLTWLDGRNNSSFSGAGLERNDFELHDYPSRRRNRSAASACAGPVDGGCAVSPHAQWQPGQLYDRGDQGRIPMRPSRPMRAATWPPTRPIPPRRRSHHGACQRFSDGGSHRAERSAQSSAKPMDPTTINGIHLPAS